jgi:hypothetical protein
VPGIIAVLLRCCAVLAQRQDSDGDVAMKVSWSHSVIHLQSHQPFLAGLKGPLRPPSTQRNWAQLGI